MSRSVETWAMEKSALLFQYHYRSHITDLEYFESNAYICDRKGD